MVLPLIVQCDLPPEVNELFQVVKEDLQLQISKSTQGSHFIYAEEGLSLMDDELGELHLDFVQDLTNYGRVAHRGKSELIAKAVGLSKGIEKVFDATLGLAQDAWFLSQLGVSVEGSERSPVVYLLLADALLRSKQSGLKIHYGDSRQWLRNLGPEPTAVYLDPMFPEKKKSALPRKEMRIFRKWVGDDSDAIELLQTALSSRAERVVVKRPLKSTELSPGVIHSFAGKTVRYDLYSPLSLRGA